MGGFSSDWSLSPRKQKGTMTRIHAHLAGKIAPKAGPMQGTSVDDKETKEQEDEINKVTENKRARQQKEKDHNA